MAPFLLPSLSINRPISFPKNFSPGMGPDRWRPLTRSVGFDPIVQLGNSGGRSHEKDAQGYHTKTNFFEQRVAEVFCRLFLMRVCFACLIVIIFLCSISLAFCEKILPVERCPIRVLSTQHKGQILDVKPGESFMLILPNPGSGGYVVRDPEFDPQILTLQKMEKKPPDPSREGDFGSFEWTFRAKKEGISALIVRAFRPWEKDKPPIVIFETSVRVTR